MARSLCYCDRKFCAYISNSPLCSTDLELTMFESYLYIVSRLAGFSSYIAQTVCVPLLFLDSQEFLRHQLVSHRQQSLSPLPIVNISNIFI